jgi:hypothetical protein
MGERHAKLAVALQEKAVQRLRAMKLEELSSSDLLRYAIEAAKLERLARGEPESIQEQRGIVEHEHQIEVFARIQQYAEAFRPLLRPGVEAGGVLGDGRGEPVYPPHAEKQKQALLLDHVQEVLYGGAAGGGKSDWLLMEALKYVQVPGYAAILLRRSYADLSLPGALMDRAEQWLKGTAARWKSTDKTWRFPSGATLTFGYLENDSDKYRYQSSEFQFVGFDEVTQFEESQYLYLFSRLRRLQGVDVPLRMRAASNPGGIGHAFVKQRFLVEGPAAGRLFIPSKLEDNPRARSGPRLECAHGGCARRDP